LRFIGWVLHLPEPAWIRGAKVQILLTRIFYGLALFFLIISIVLHLNLISREIPDPFSSNFDYTFAWFGGMQKIFEIFLQSGVLILAIALAKKKLFAILIIGVNVIIALFHVIQRSPWQDLQGYSLGFQFKWYFKTMIGRLGQDVEWNFAEISMILSAILTIAAVIVAFSISNNNLPKLTPVPIKPTPPQARIIPKTATGITGDAVEQVEKLGNLLAKGLLTQEEFDKKKKQILGL
jgi:hypothetical protein